MPALVETMAYRRRDEADVPWHGLGEAVTSAMSDEEMLKTAGLDWRVQRRKLWMHVDPAREEFTEVPGALAITRSSDGYVFQVASDRYHPVQNWQMVKFFKDYTEAGGMQLETLGALKHGAIVWALASIEAAFELPGKDKVKGYVLLANSHDGSMTYQGKHTSIRVVCWNTLSAALGEDTELRFAMRHTHKLTTEDVRAAKRALGLAREELRRTEEVAQMLAERKVEANGQEVMQYVAAIFQPDLLAQVVQKTTEVQDAESLLDAVVAESTFKPKKLKEEDFGAVGKAVLHAIVEAPGSDLVSAKDTWWGALNGVTYYVDHERGRSRDTGLASAWFGKGEQVKQQAMELAVKMAQR